MRSNFLTKFRHAYNKKKSILCVGFDPALPSQRPKNTIPEEMTRLDYLMEVLEQVAPHCIAIKPNRQYLLGLSTDQIKRLNEKAHNYDLLSICDHKLTDIGSSNLSALYWLKEEKFDAFTFSPFAGNVQETYKAAHNLGLGVISLTLMSNPQAKWMVEETIQKQPAYLYYATQVKNYADAAVVGATGHVATHHIKKIKQKIDNKLILAPGVGAQGGDARKLIDICGNELLINVGRAILYADNPGQTAQKYNTQFNSFLQ